MAEPATTTTKSLLLRALPSPVVSAIRVFRRLAPASRPVVARVWLRRLFTRSSPLPAGRDPSAGTLDDVRVSFRLIAQAVDALSATLSLAGTREAGNSG